MCQKSRFKKTNVVLQTFTLTCVYVCDKVQYISPMTQITFFGFGHHYRILSHNNIYQIIPEMNLYVVLLFKTILACFRLKYS